MPLRFVIYDDDDNDDLNVTEAGLREMKDVTEQKK